MTPNFRRAFLAASAVSLLGPASALAGVTVDRTGTVLTVTATGGTPNSEVSVRKTNPVDPADASIYVWVDGYGALTGTGTCLDSGDEAWCGDADLTSVSVDLTATGGGLIDLGPGIVPSGGVGYPAQVLGGSGATHVAADAGTYNVQFTGGAAADVAQLAGGNDLFTGMGGDDRMFSSAGDDQFMGGDGNDLLETSEAPDGADLFEGGGEGEYDPEYRYTGDAVVYEDRTTGITATIPLDASNTASTGNGAAGENDRLLGVETVVGGLGANVLHGNDVGNDLFGAQAGDVITGGDGDDYILSGAGADDVRSGGGDDTIEARRNYGSPTPDADVALDCGPGTDRIRRDNEDPAPVACERDIPGFLSRDSAIAGKLNVGSVITATNLATFAGPGTTVTTWVSCANTEYDDCKDLAKGTSYTLTAAELGRRIYAYSVVEDAWRDGDENSTELSNPVGAALPVPAPTPAPPVATPAPPAFSTVAAAAALKALGAGASLVPNLKLGSGVAAFTPKASKKGKLPVGKKPAPLLGVVCQAGCKVQSTVTVTLPGAKGKKKTLKFKAQKTTVAPGVAAVVTLKTTASQRKAIKKAKNAKASVKVGVTQGGKTTTDKTSVKLEVKP